MITSVFRFQDGEAVGVDPRTYAPATDPDERERLIEQLAAKARKHAARNPSAFVWVKVANPSHQELRFLTRAFGLPALQVDDAANPRQRPKLEAKGQRVFAVFKELRYVVEHTAVETGQMAVFLGPGFAVSVRHGDAAPGSARRALARNIELTRFGPVSVLHAIVDVIVDGYLAIANRLGTDMEAVEEIVFSSARVDNSGRIYNLKRENLEIRRAVMPLAAAAHQAVAEKAVGIPKELAPFFRDVGDHLLRTIDLVESNDNLLMAMLMAATSQQDLRQNEDMRKISAWVAIAAVPTAMAGVYGMNFDQMPELHWQFGYPLVLGTMFGVCGFLYRRFKKSGWL